MEVPGGGIFNMCYRRILKEFCLLVLSFLYISVGVKHFTNPDFFLAIMPPYVPYHKFMVYLTGVLEIVFGLMMIFRKTRFYGCWGIILLLIAVFVANIYLYNSEIPQERDLIYYSKSYSVNLILTYKYIVFNVVGKSNKMKKYSF